MTDKEKILKWCGFEWWETAEAWCYGKNEVTRDPTLDMNFYFKYAKETLIEKLKWGKYVDFMEKWLDEVVMGGKDPAEAFKNALLKLIGEE